MENLSTETKKVKHGKIIFLFLALIIISYFVCRVLTPSKQIKNTITNIPVIVATPDYTIAEREDVSYADVKRLRFKVSVKSELSEQDIKAICNEVISKFSYYNAIHFMFYLGDSTSGPYTAGLATWAPYGDWGRAKEKNNYSLTITTGSFWDTVEK